MRHWSNSFLEISFFFSQWRWGDVSKATGRSFARLCNERHNTEESERNAASFVSRREWSAVICGATSWPENFNFFHSPRPWPVSLANRPLGGPHPPQMRNWMDSLAPAQHLYKLKIKIQGIETDGRNGELAAEIYLSHQIGDIMINFPPVISHFPSSTRAFIISMIYKCM